MSEYFEGESRILALENKRKKQINEFQKKKEQITTTVSSNISSIDSKFALQSNFSEEQFKSSTIGLVTLEDFKKKQQIVVKETTVTTIKQKKRKQADTSKLSFNIDEEEEEVFQPLFKKTKVTKNPTVDTSFLPDRERDNLEKLERDNLREEWLQEQERIKEEMIAVTYSYWDGTGHRRTTTVKKGTTIDKFLEIVRQEFKELRGTGINDLLFVKEDIIIPHHYSFYELIITKARGKSGPLFSWDVHEDIRLLSDAQKEKDESHAAKVVERRWYDRNKHIFPACRWEVFDPAVKREKYTHRDSNKS